jgi:transposase
MGKTKDITPYVKGKIEGLLVSGKFKNKEIAKICHVSPTTISRIKKKLVQNVPISGNNRKNCKGVKKTTQREDRIIAKVALLNRGVTLEHLRSLLKRFYSISLSINSIKLRLKKQGIVHAKKSKKFVLNQAMMKKRRQWAYKLRKWGPAEFSRVI